MGFTPGLEWQADDIGPSGDELLCPGCQHRAQHPVRDLLTPQEVGAILRRSRTWTYAQLRLYIDTGGTEGVPCYRDGPNLFTPRQWLEDYLGYVITHIPPHNGWDHSTPDQPAARRPRRRRNRRLRLTDQLDLPFEE